MARGGGTACVLTSVRQLGEYFLANLKHSKGSKPMATSASPSPIPGARAEGPILSSEKTGAPRCVQPVVSLTIRLNPLRSSAVERILENIIVP
jgi:hypothetical protein